LAYESLKFAYSHLFGRPILPSYRMEQADLILGFGADFLETWLSPWNTPENSGSCTPRSPGSPVMLAIILAKRLFAFFVVSDIGPPSWDYRPVRDVPASSAYAVYRPLPYSQHIRGLRGK
jgi:hypothetical protein